MTETRVRLKKHWRVFYGLDGMDNDKLEELGKIGKTPLLRFSDETIFLAFFLLHLILGESLRTAK